jgi:hypothetical protein
MATGWDGEDKLLRKRDGVGDLEVICNSKS